MKRIFVVYLPDIDLQFLENQVLTYLSEDERDKYNSFKHPLRRKEWLAVRWILKKNLGFIPRIVYDSFGKPYFSYPSFHLGISHSRDYAVVCLSDNPCAVDIDSIDREYTKISSRYLSSAELEACKQEKEKLALSWIAKEAVYKLVSARSVVFAEEILIELPQHLKNFGYFYGRFIQTQEITCLLKYYLLKNNFLVVAEYENEPVSESAISHTH